MTVKIYNIDTVRKMSWSGMIPRQDIINFYHTDMNVGQGANPVNTNLLCMREASIVRPKLSDRDILFKCFAVMRELEDILETSASAFEHPRTYKSEREQVIQTMRNSAHITACFIADCCLEMEGGEPLYCDNLFTYLGDDDGK